MIELISVFQKSPADIIEDVKAGKIHIVCMAQNGLTHLNVYAELYYKLPRNLVKECVDLVNFSRETGTLYPKAFITILPKTELRNQNLIPLTFDELKKCLEDVFKANEEYLKSEIIYFTLESGYVDLNSAKMIVNELINENSRKELFVKTIWFEN